MALFQYTCTERSGGHNLMECDIQNIKKKGIVIDVQKAGLSKTGKWVTLSLFSKWLYFC